MHLPHGVPLGGLVALLALAGCASQPPAPVAEVAAARAMVTQAQPVAARHAPEALREAQAKLDRAEAAMAREQFAEARMLAEQAEADARFAWARGEHERSRASVAEVNQGLETLRQELQRRSQ